MCAAVRLKRAHFQRTVQCTNRINTALALVIIFRHNKEILTIRQLSYYFRKHNDFSLNLFIVTNNLLTQETEYYLCRPTDANIYWDVVVQFDVLDKQGILSSKGKFCLHRRKRSRVSTVNLAPCLPLEP